MKIGILYNPIKHERNNLEKARFETLSTDEMFEVLDAAFSEICPLEEVAESLIETLRKVNPGTKEVVVVGNIVMIETSEDIREVDIAGFSFADLFTSMVAAVLN